VFFDLVLNQEYHGSHGIPFLFLFLFLF